MIDHRNLAVLAACLLVAGGGYWWLEGAKLPALAIPGMRDDAPDTVQEAAKRGGSVVYQKAILACLLAASYGAERGARIDQVETLLQETGSNLSPAERRDVDALTAQLPDHRRERDASYLLYFNGIAALAGASADQTTAAFADIGRELDAAGLQRLTRYIPVIRQHIDTYRNGPRDAARDQQWIGELKNAVKV